MQKPVRHNKTVSLTLALSVFSLLIALHLSSNQQTAHKTEPAKEETSLASQTPKRQMKLGQAQVSERKGKEASVIFNDPTMGKNWGLSNIDTASAWRVSSGSREVIVAVIDTGIDIRHPDLARNLWVNKGEVGLDASGRDRATNGKDDDGNGFIDDVHGWNFVSNSNNLSDNHGHGTHIAGIVGAEGGNGVGISGVAPRVSLMILKYFDPRSSGVDNLKNTVAAIRYATKMNAHIINYSGGGLEYSQQEYDAVAEAAKRQILFVAAAGNEKSNSDNVKYFPADYELPNIISVTAVDPRTNILPTSNYGIQTVDIAAPGEEIYSTLPNGKYGKMTGTSQATAFVSGVAALIKANNMQLKADDIAKYILKTGDKVPTLQAKVGTSTRLNSYRSLSILDQGVAASGVIAANTVNMPQHQFASDPRAKIENSRPSEDIALFSRDILQKLKQVAPASTTSPEKPLN